MGLVTNDRQWEAACVLCNIQNEPIESKVPANKKGIYELQKSMFTSAPKCSEKNHFLNFCQPIF